MHHSHLFLFILLLLLLFPLLLLRLPINPARLLILLILAVVLLPVLLLLLLTVLDLILNQIVEGGNGADQTTEVDGHQLIISLDTHGVGQLAVLGGWGIGGGAVGDVGGWLGCGEVGEEVEYILEVSEDGVVDGQSSIEHFLEVLANIA